MITCDCHTLLFATERSGVWSLPLQALGTACRECHTISYDRPVDGAVYGVDIRGAGICILCLWRIAS